MGEKNNTAYLIHLGAFCCLLQLFVDLLHLKALFLTFSKQKRVIILYIYFSICYSYDYNIFLVLGLQNLNRRDEYSNQVYCIELFSHPACKIFFVPSRDPTFIILDEDYLYTNILLFKLPYFVASRGLVIFNINRKLDNESMTNYFIEKKNDKLAVSFNQQLHYYQSFLCCSEIYLQYTNGNL